MSRISPELGNKLGKMIRMLSSSNDGDIISAARAINKTLKANKLDIHALADALNGGKDDLPWEDNHSKVYTEADMAVVFEERYKQGYQAGVDASRLASTADKIYREGIEKGKLQAWNEYIGQIGLMAKFCNERKTRLKPREAGFVEDMCIRTMDKRYKASQKQIDWLVAIYEKVRRGA